MYTSMPAAVIAVRNGCGGIPTKLSVSEYDMIRYETTTKNGKTEKLKSKSRYVRSNSKSLGNRVAGSEAEKKKGCSWKDLQKKKVLSTVGAISDNWLFVETPLSLPGACVRSAANDSTVSHDWLSWPPRDYISHSLTQRNGCDFSVTANKSTQTTISDSPVSTH